jgi:hypothetical protein
MQKIKKSQFEKLVNESVQNEINDLLNEAFNNYVNEQTNNVHRLINDNNIIVETKRKLVLTPTGLNENQTRIKLVDGHGKKYSVSVDNLYKGINENRMIVCNKQQLNEAPWNNPLNPLFPLLAPVAGTAALAKKGIGAIKNWNQNRLNAQEKAQIDALRAKGYKVISPEEQQTEQQPQQNQQQTAQQPDVNAIANDVIAGKYGNGVQRSQAIDKQFGAGTYAKVQPIVNQRMAGTNQQKPAVAQNSPAPVPPPMQPIQNPVTQIPTQKPQLQMPQRQMA